MLVFSRKKQEKIIIANGLITINVVSVMGDRVRIGIDAPKDIEVDREEIYLRKQQGEEQKSA